MKSDELDSTRDVRAVSLIKLYLYRGCETRLGSFHGGRGRILILKSDRAVHVITCYSFYCNTFSDDCRFRRLCEWWGALNRVDSI